MKSIECVGGKAVGKASSNNITNFFSSIFSFTKFGHVWCLITSADKKNVFHLETTRFVSCYPQDDVRLTQNVKDSFYQHPEKMTEECGMSWLDLRRYACASFFVATICIKSRSPKI